MFQAIEAAFERREVLRSQTLNDLINSGLIITEQTYASYGDGILQDFTIEQQEGVIAVKKGLIKYQGKIYYNDEDMRLYLSPDNTMEYLKIVFHEAESSGGLRKWSTDLVLDDKKPERNNECELCRFQYQEGAKLRNAYSSFQDCASSFNVVNRLHAKYAAPGGDGLAPVITMKFAEEMQKHPIKDPVDFMFMMECARGDVINRKAVIAYLQQRMGTVINKTTNQDLFNELGKVLEGQGKFQGSKPREQRMIII